MLLCFEFVDFAAPCYSWRFEIFQIVMFSTGAFLLNMLL